MKFVEMEALQLSLASSKLLTINVIMKQKRDTEVRYEAYSGEASW